MAATVREKVVSDLLKFETDQRYNRKVVTFINETGDAAAFEIGQMLELSSANYAPIVSGQTDPVALLLENLPEMADDATASATVLVRGPAVVDKAQIISPDSGATLLSQLAALEVLGIVAKDEPTLTTTQTT